VPSDERHVGIDQPRPSAVLDKRTPLAALRAGDVDRVVAEATGVGAV